MSKLQSSKNFWIKFQLSRSNDNRPEISFSNFRFVLNQEWRIGGQSSNVTFGSALDGFK